MLFYVCFIPGLFMPGCSGCRHPGLLYTYSDTEQTEFYPNRNKTMIRYMLIVALSFHAFIQYLLLVFLPFYSQAFCLKSHTLSQFSSLYASSPSLWALSQGTWCTSRIFSLNLYHLSFNCPHFILSRGQSKHVS